MWRTSAYIDINAWEAGIAQRPEEYAWCSFAAAVKGDEKARRGYAFMYGNADDWGVIRDCHEKSMREAMSEILAAREAERAEREAKGGGLRRAAGRIPCRRRRIPGWKCRGDSSWSSRAAIRRLSNGSSLSWPTAR